MLDASKRLVVGVHRHLVPSRFYFLVALILAAAGLRGEAPATLAATCAVQTASARSLELAQLDGTNGFLIGGINTADRAGTAVSGAGDVNGDGLDDLLVGARLAAPNGRSAAGQGYVIFGTRAGFPSGVALSTLDGTNGFAINGVNVGDRAGASLARTGDVNGDGLADLIIGAPGASPNGKGSAGRAYVIFGTRAGFPAKFELSSLDGTNGFVINGIDVFDGAGFAVSGAADVNGDGVDDLVIGADQARPNGVVGAGQAYVVFGTRGGFPASFDLASLDGTNGFVINGLREAAHLGLTVSGAGDVNGDGVADLVIGAPGASRDGVILAGQAYVILGTRGGFPASFDLASLDGTNGFAINGLHEGDRLGTALSGAGDVNGDGLADLIIGAQGASPNGKYNAGQAYVIFGTRGGFPASFDLASLDGTNGFAINGGTAYDTAGRSVSGAGDVNGDGLADLIIGAPGADPNSNTASGTSYGIYGSRAGFPAALDLAVLDATRGWVVNGAHELDESGSPVTGAGDINGDGLADLIIGTTLSQPGRTAPGLAYVVFGSAQLGTPNRLGFGSNSAPGLCATPTTGSRAPKVPAASPREDRRRRGGAP